jgi:putative oxidoreductase
MLVATTTKAAYGLWVQHDGVEHPLLHAILAAVVAVARPGRWSVDHLAGLPHSLARTLGAIGVGVVAAAVTVSVLRQRPEDHPL